MTAKTCVRSFGISCLSECGEQRRRRSYPADDDQRDGGRIEREGIWFSVDLRHACFLGIERPGGADFVVG